MAHNTVKRQCEACGEDFLTNNAEIRKGNGKYCSRRCCYAGRKRVYVDLVCAVCGQTYSLRLGDYNWRVKQGHAVKYCSVQCAAVSPERNQNLSASLKQSEAVKAARAIYAPKAKATKNTPEYRTGARDRFRQQMKDPAKRARWEEGIKRRSNNPQWRDAPWHQRGENNPNYKGDRRARGTAMGRQEYRDWRKAVFMRDHYICQECGKHTDSLIAHHVKPWAGHPDLRYNVENGITLCEHCHDLKHGKVRKPKTYHCVDCGKPKTDGKQPRCRSCGAKFGNSKKHL